MQIVDAVERMFVAEFATHDIHTIAGDTTKDDEHTPIDLH